MMRLPLFEFRAPRTLEEAARILDGEGAGVMPLAGGTDLLPNMKRRQQVPKTLMSLRYIEDLNHIAIESIGVAARSLCNACGNRRGCALSKRFDRAGSRPRLWWRLHTFETWPRSAAIFVSIRAATIMIRIMSGGKQSTFA